MANCGPIILTFSNVSRPKILLVVKIKTLYKQNYQNCIDAGDATLKLTNVSLNALNKFSKIRQAV